MAHNTDFPDLEGARATTLNGISLYIWRAAIFRVPLSTLQNRTEDGSTELIDVAAHCRALVLTRFWVPRYRSGSLTAEWLNVRALLSPRTNPPHIRVIPRTLEYLCIYFHEWACIELQRQAETQREFKRRVYNTLRNMSTAENKPREVRVMQLQQAIGKER